MFSKKFGHLVIYLLTGIGQWVETMARHGSQQGLSLSPVLGDAEQLVHS